MKTKFVQFYKNKSFKTALFMLFALVATSGLTMVAATKNNNINKAETKVATDVSAEDLVQKDAEVPASKTTDLPKAKLVLSNGVYTRAEAQVIVEREVLRLVNAERARKGLRPLAYNAKLAWGADIRASEESIPSFVGVNHIRPNGTKFSTVFKQVGYTRIRLGGENLVWGYQPRFTYNNKNLKALAYKMFTRWKNSPGHYALMMKPTYRETGVGVSMFNQGNRTYWFGIELFGVRY